MNTQVKIFISIIFLLIVGTFVAVMLRQDAEPAGPGKYDAFAMCLGEKGATFYGTFWCPVCQAQKKMFGSSSKLLPYFECSTPNGQGQIPACTEKGIDRYPTWIFADGEKKVGQIPLEEVALKTGCVLPE